jgi:YegS/Rv2252/BmrU family lipid kinase
MASLYKRIHVVINPASGKDEPILNVLNDVFHQHDVTWEASITMQYGDATRFARQAAEAGFDLVAGYGGDGTQHEIANGILGTDAVMGVLPGGTGNGFANELVIPRKLRPAVELLCTSQYQRKIDAVQLGDSYFIQRLYVGIEPEEQTSRESKDKYGTFAYAVDAYHRSRGAKEVKYQITIDGELIEIPAMKVYIVNSAQSGTRISVTGGLSSPDDGLVGVFVLDSKNMETLRSAASRSLHLHTSRAENFFWRGKEIAIDTDPDQPVWTDGEYSGRTPVTAKVIPGALTVAAPEPKK